MSGETGSVAKEGRRDRAKMGRDRGFKHLKRVSLDESVVRIQEYMGIRLEI